MKILILLVLLLSFTLNASLAPHIMEQLAAQIPGISTGTTTPRDMHEAWDRYEATAEMFLKKSVKYRISCYKELFRYEKNTGTDLYMIHGVSPDNVCDYYTKRMRSGYVVPNVESLFSPRKDKRITD